MTIFKKYLQQHICIDLCHTKIKLTCTTLDIVFQKLIGCLLILKQTWRHCLSLTSKLPDPYTVTDELTKSIPLYGLAHLLTYEYLLFTKQTIKNIYRKPFVYIRDTVWKVQNVSYLNTKCSQIFCPFNRIKNAVNKIKHCCGRCCENTVNNEENGNQTIPFIIKQNYNKVPVDDFTLGEYAEKVSLYGFLMVSRKKRRP